MRIITSGTGGWRYVDCVSVRGGKLEALEYVRTLFGVPRDRCAAAGDSGNDILMLEGAAPRLAARLARPPLARTALLGQAGGDRRSFTLTSPPPRTAPDGTRSVGSERAKG